MRSASATFRTWPSEPGTTGRPICCIARRVRSAEARHRLEVELAQRADDADRDLAAVRDEDFLEGGHGARDSCAMEKRFPSVSPAVASVTPSPGRRSGGLVILPPAAATDAQAASMSST